MALSALPPPGDPLRKVVSALAGAELDDAKVREFVLVVFADDGVDLLPALADRQDDRALPRNLPAGHEEIHGISAATYYNWKSKYGGMSASELKRLKETEDRSMSSCSARR